MFSDKCKTVYLISYRDEIVSFWRKSLRLYCAVRVFPETGLFFCSLRQNEHFDDALIIIDSESIISADDFDFSRLREIISFKKVFFIESTQLDERIKLGFEAHKVNLIPFPCNFETVKNQMKLISSLKFVKTDIHQLEKIPVSLNRFAGNSYAVKSLRSNFFTFGKTDLPLILEGETGTGKTFAAELIHSISGRNGKKFRRINMPCVQEEIVESELFGTVSGAFTGAVNKKGLLEETDGGTVLFDEISEIPLRFQAKLLKFLDSGCYCRVGSSRECHADVRIICATNANLEEMVERRLFRRDLYERLKGKVISLPSLNSHTEDIGPLVENYLLEKGRSNITFTPEAISELQNHIWKGNVRELQFCVELTCSVAGKNVIGPEDLVFAS